jgi:hypothetical protein
MPHLDQEPSAAFLNPARQNLRSHSFINFGNCADGVEQGTFGVEFRQKRLLLSHRRRLCWQAGNLLRVIIKGPRAFDFNHAHTHASLSLILFGIEKGNTSAKARPL